MRSTNQIVGILNTIAKRIENWRADMSDSIALKGDTRPIWKELSEDMVQMIYVECPNCGYHMGVDYTFMDQVHEGDLDIECPVCEMKGLVKGVEE